MLVQEQTFKALPIASIRSSARIGVVTDTLINPHNLHVDALYTQILGEKNALLLLPEDIREISPRGIIINDHEHLLATEDAIRLKPILSLRFELINLKAYVGKKHIGSVEGYAIESDSLYIQKIYIKPTLVKRINAQKFTFDRSQVVEVNKNAIVFKDSSRVTALKPVLATKKLVSPPAQIPSSTSLTKS